MGEREAIPKSLERFCSDFGVKFVGYEGVPIEGDYGSATEGGGVPIGSIVRFVYACEKCGTSFSTELFLHGIPTGTAFMTLPYCPEGCNKPKK